MLDSQLRDTSFYIDFSALLRGNCPALLREMAGLVEYGCRWYVPASFDHIIDLLLSEQSGDFITGEMLDCLSASWEQYRNLPIRLTDRGTTALSSWADALSERRTACLVTGDEAAARAAAQLGRGKVLLVRRADARWMDRFTEKPLEQPEMHPVPAFEEACCRISKKVLGLTRWMDLPLEELISGDGAEGVIWSAGQGSWAVKIFDTEVAWQKLKKLELLCALPAPGPNFAWPQELVYPPDRSVREPVGFVMPRFADCRGLEELFYLNVSPHVRWKAATSFLGQVMRLHMEGVLVGDFNWNNFAITDDCDVLFMDVDSYVYQNYGTQVKGQQPLPRKIDYSRYYDVYWADDRLACCVAFALLTGSPWPYYYNEDTGEVECRLTDPDRDICAALDRLPALLRERFCKNLASGAVWEPSSLYLRLLEAEPEFR